MPLKQIQAGPIRILLVEDSETDATLLKAELEHADHEPFGRYEITVACSLAEAVAVIDASEIDLILLDLQLPDSFGIETVQSMRAGSGLIPIIVLTSTDDEHLALQCIAAGAADYLCKGIFQHWTIRRAIAYTLVRRAAQRKELEAFRVKAGELIEPATPRGASPASEPGLAARVIPMKPPQEAIKALRPSYASLYRAYLEHLGRGGQKPIAALESMVTELGEVQAGSGDLILLHLGALDDALRGVDSDRQRTLALEGRHMVLEMMGHLADFYRARVFHSTTQGAA